jgi:hypothetical protein
MEGRKYINKDGTMKQLYLTITKQNEEALAELSNDDGTILGTAKIPYPDADKCHTKPMTFCTIYFLIMMDERGIFDSLMYTEGYENLTVRTPEQVFHGDLVDTVNAIDLPIEFEIVND